MSHCTSRVLRRGPFVSRWAGRWPSSSARDISPQLSAAPLGSRWRSPRDTLAAAPGMPRTHREHRGRVLYTFPKLHWAACWALLRHAGRSTGSPGRSRSLFAPPLGRPRATCHRCHRRDIDLLPRPLSSTAAECWHFDLAEGHRCPPAVQSRSCRPGRAASAPWALRATPKSPHPTANLPRSKAASRRSHVEALHHEDPNKAPQKRS
mmetsp:Transcript_81411/g.128767  ORF Transcript_81411/g.128767 Transcript_81411/m.128767 type:complete len:207 (+) Transcript_81411:898-1518(+)